MRILAALSLLLLSSVALAQGAPRTVTLDQALAAARQNQPTLVVARAQAAQARARVDEVRAPLLPQLTGRLSYQRTERQGSGSGVTAIPGAGFDAYQASLGVTQLVWDFGQTTGRLHAAEASAEAQEASGDTSLRDALLDVRTSYFQCRAEKALVQVAKETLENQQRHLEQVQAYIQVGTRPEIDLAQARTDMANARLALIRAENAYATARMRLNQATGVVASADFEVADESLPAVPGEDGTLDEALAQALRARPELRSLLAQRRSQEETIGATRAAYWPTVAVSGSAVESGDAPGNLGASLIAGITLSWSFYQGGQTRAQVKEAELGGVILDAQAERQRQAVRVETDSALLAVRGAKSEIVAADEAHANARERLRLAEGRYQTGVGSIIELGDAQVAVTNAAGQKVQADYDLATARAQLLHALGAEG